MRHLDLAWETVEREGPGVYDEAYLASIRKALLAAEKDGDSVTINFSYIAPAWAKDIHDDKEVLENHYSAAFLHAQRRLKNCKAAAGWTRKD